MLHLPRSFISSNESVMIQTNRSLSIVQLLSKNVPRVQKTRIKNDLNFLTYD